MNIFYRSKCPRKAAESLCEQHVVKMPLEPAQILSTAHRYLEGNLVAGRTWSGRKATRWVQGTYDDKF